jgi:uncharacterized membrane protein YraQ (UPF0718 family)
MRSHSFLQEVVRLQKKSQLEQPIKKKHRCRDQHIFYLIWILIGMLVSGVALAAVVTLYLRPSCKQNTKQNITRIFNNMTLYLLINYA